MSPIGGDAARSSHYHGYWSEEVEGGEGSSSVHIETAPPEDTVNVRYQTIFIGVDPHRQILDTFQHILEV